MKLKFKNIHIWWCVESIWDNADFDYKFKTQINQLMKTNSNDDFEQEVEISKDVLVYIYKATSTESEGVASAINKELKDLLLPQLLAESNNDIDNPNEALSMLLAIQELDEIDKNAKNQKILKGKYKTLK